MDQRKYVDAVLALPKEKLDIWKYFEDRAEKINERVWSTGTWLMSLIAATLTMPFVAKLIVFPGGGHMIQITFSVPLAAISVFGLILCLIFRSILNDHFHHVVANWNRASVVLYGGLAEPVDQEAMTRVLASRHALIIVNYFAIVAFIILFLLACFPQVVA